MIVKQKEQKVKEVTIYETQDGHQFPTIKSAETYNDMIESETAKNVIKFFNKDIDRCPGEHKKDKIANFLEWMSLDLDYTDNIDINIHTFKGYIRMIMTLMENFHLKEMIEAMQEDDRCSRNEFSSLDDGSEETEPRLQPEELNEAGKWTVTLIIICLLTVYIIFS